MKQLNFKIEDELHSQMKERLDENCMCLRKYIIKLIKEDLKKDDRTD